MTNCCSPESATDSLPKRYTCPINGKEYALVQSKTIMHHINEPWAWNKKQQGYYFCDDPDCPVVYFGQDNSIIEKSALRTTVGIKEKSIGSIVCYCFGVNINIARENQDVKAFVVRNTKEHNCACDIRNPSGRCCLKDFPKS